MEDNLTLNQQLTYNSVLADTLEKYYTPQLTVDPERYVGIEVEVENAASDTVHEIISHNFIKITEDGSLRNNGLEYITCPHKSKYTASLLEQLFSLLHKDHKFTTRTSIHIHVNARDMTPIQIRGLVLVYLTVERLLYNWIKNDRDKSIFCVPIIETELATYLLNKKKYDWMKYTGLNLKPLTGLGTIEFRHMHGNKDLQRNIEPWLNMILCLFKFATQHDYKYIQGRVFELNTTSNYYTFLHDVFGHYAGLLAHPEYHKDMEEGVCYIKTHSITNTYAKKCSIVHQDSPYVKRKQELAKISETLAKTNYINTATVLFNGTTMDTENLVQFANQFLNTNPG